MHIKKILFFAFLLFSFFAITSSVDAQTYLNCVQGGGDGWNSSGGVSPACFASTTINGCFADGRESVSPYNPGLVNLRLVPCPFGEDGAGIVEGRSQDNGSFPSPCLFTPFGEWQNACSPNVPPTVNAGTDRSITLPTNSTSASGSASVSGGAMTISWSKTAGPSATITGGTTLTPTFSGLVAGNYTFTMTVTDDDGGVSSDAMNVAVAAAGSVTGTLSASNCTIAQNASSCPSNISWSVTNPGATTQVTTPTSIVVGSGHSGSTTYQVTGGQPNGTRTFYLYNSGSVPALDQKTATASCNPAGDIWDIPQGKCVINTGTTNTLTVFFGGNGGTGTVTSSPPGISGGTTSAQFTQGTNVSLSASPNGGSSFGGWSGEGCSGFAGCTVSMTQARNVTAIFNTSGGPTPVVSISANPTSGTVGVVNPGLTWSATNTPTSCSASGDWSGAKAVSGTNVSQGVLNTVKTYTFSLACANGNGTGPTANATVVVGPASPTGVNATPQACGTNRIDLSWNHPISGATSYNILRSTTSGSGYGTIISGGTNAPTFADTGGLTPGTTYYYVMQSNGPGGTSGNSNQASAVAPPLCGSVPTVISPTMTSQTSSGATLGANVTSLGVPASISARGTCWGTTTAPTTNCSPASGTTTGIFTHARTGMMHGTTYYYRGYATNATGTGYSTTASFNTITATDLTADPATPSTATAGTPLTFSSTLRNIGSGNPGVNFNNFFQVANGPAGTGTTADLAFATTSNLLAGTSRVITSPPHNFLPGSGAVQSVRMCADKNDSSSLGFVQEWDETNNCGAWTDVTVSGGGTVPTVTTPTHTSVTSSGATLGANVTSLGTPASISARGTCWGTTPAPTGNCTAASGTTTGVYTHARTGMPSGTLIYYRGYATNTTGTGYSADSSFTTTAANVVPTVTTPTHSAITTTGATLGANVTSLGVPAAISARGTCWGTTPAPTSNCVAASGTTTGVYTHARTGMPSSTLIYYRGYATNTTGTGYSADSSFTTGAAALPNLTYGVITPTTATAGTPVTFTMTVTNNGGASTGASFPNLFRVATAANGGGTVTTISANTLAALGAGISAPVSSNSYTFPAAGTYSVRVIVDEDAAFANFITESNEGDNMTPWTNVVVSSGTFTVTPSAGANGTISPSTPQSVTSGATTNFTVTPTSGYSASMGGTCGGAPASGSAAFTFTTSPVTANCTVTATFTQMTGTLTPPSNSCTIASGGSSCVSPLLTWTTTNPIGTSAVTNNGTATPASPSGNNSSSTFTVPYYSAMGGVTTFYLYNNALLLAQSTVTTTCIGGSGWNGSICAANSAPVVGSPTVGSITTTSATLGGTITSAGSPATITARGTCYGPNANPGLGGLNGGICAAEGGTSTGVFSHNRTGLTPGTTYHYRAYATNASGTGYTTDATFATNGSMSGTITPSSSTCNIPNLASSCTINFSWSVSNPVGATTSVTSDTNNSGAASPNFQVATGHTGTNVAFTIPYLNNGSPSSRNFYLYNNGVLLDQETGTITASCAPTTAWDSTDLRCETVVLPPQIDTFDATPPSINFGESSTISWSSSNATNCTSDFGGSGTSGSVQVSPLVTTPYNLTCTGNSLQTNGQVTVTVGAAPSRKPIYIEPQ